LGCQRRILKSVELGLAKLDLVPHFAYEEFQMLSRRQNLLHGLGLPLVYLTLFSLAGGHWAVLQTIAWAKMLRDYSESGSIAMAVEKTFGGKYPCSLCLKVEEGRQKEKESPATVKLDKKAEIFFVTAPATVEEPAFRPFSYLIPGDLPSSSRSDPPPAPIPILAS
jgi:hypothetical protein